MNIALRDYQIECLQDILNESKAGVCRQLISLPTGSGKTVIMSALAKELNKKTLVIAHREELIIQAVEKFKLVWPEASIGVCMTDMNEIESQVVVGSVQSCSRPKRLKRLHEQGFEMLMIDEAHHAPSESYQSIIGSLGFTGDTSKLLIGVTATPLRADKQGLGNTFEKITFSRSTGTMIKAGYLAPVIGRKILTNLSLNRLTTRNGDFATEELSRAVNTKGRNEFVVSKYKEYAGDRKGIAFCANVQHCKNLAEAFRTYGIESEAVYGDMANDERRRILNGLKQGKFQVVTSCGILTEGFDEPSIACIAMARPTKSKGLYIQCVGRGLRLYPGKTNCLVLDFTDIHNNIDNIASLSTTIPEAICHQERDVQEKEPFEQADCHASHVEDLRHHCDKEFDILGGTRFLWIPIGDDEWSLLDDERNEIVVSPSAEGYIADIYWYEGKRQTITTKPMPLTYCSGVCEDFARRHLKIVLADQAFSWMNESTPATEGQRKFLEKCGIGTKGFTKYSAAIEIKRLIASRNKAKRAMKEESATVKQKYALHSYGINPEGMSKLQAMQRISEIKKAM